MNQDQLTPEPSAPPVKPAKKSVLLIDAEPERQLTRATAMRERGVIVDAVHSGGEARALWKPHSYQLVMIELAGAAPDADEFYRYVLDREPNQRFAFYSNIPPYLTSTPPVRRTGDASPAESRRAPVPASGNGAPTTPRAADPSNRPRLERPATPPKLDTSFSEAVKNAERDLFGRS